MSQGRWKGKGVPQEGISQGLVKNASSDRVADISHEAFSLFVSNLPLEMSKV